MMLHKIYKKEKERIGKGYIWFIVGAFLWSFAMTHIFCQIAKEDASYVEFYHNILFAIGIIWYLNSKLFFVKEQGEMECIFEKYKILPIRTKTLYLVRIRIMLEDSFLCIAAMIFAYLLTLGINEYMRLDSLFVIKVFEMCICTIIFMLILILVKDVYAEYVRRRQ